MKATSNLIFLLLIIPVFHSCTVYRQIPIEILRTEEIKLPETPSNIAFVYRNFKFPNDTMQLYYIEDDVLRSDRSGRTRDIDSMVVSACLLSAANGLKQNNICENPVFYPVDIFPRQTGENIPVLPAELIKKMAVTIKADYLVVLETITYFFYKYHSNGENPGYQQVKLAGMWNLYNGSTGIIKDHKAMVDTVFWDDDTGSAFKTSDLPPRIPALVQAGETFGENYAKRFYAEWIKVDRLLVVPPLEDFRAAGEYVSNQEWDKAADIWKKYADSRFGRLAISACYNLTLSMEISDDLTGASKWINRAVEMAKSFKNSDDLKLCLEYQNLLKKRLLDIQKSRNKD
jgi:hypothetical protein